MYYFIELYCISFYFILLYCILLYFVEYYKFLFSFMRLKLHLHSHYLHLRHHSSLLPSFYSLHSLHSISRSISRSISTLTTTANAATAANTATTINNNNNSSSNNDNDNDNDNITINNINHVYYNKYLLLLDNLSSVFNHITGYHLIVISKQRVLHKQNILEAARSTLLDAKHNYHLATDQRRQCQKELNSLLQRKDTWIDSDVIRFTHLFRKDVVFEQDEMAAKLNYTKATEHYESATSDFLK